LVGGGFFGPVLELSPDGENLVLVGSQNGRSLLYLRALDRVEAQVMAGTEGARRPFFSPDGNWLAFFADGKLKKISLAGGAPVVIGNVPGTPMGGSWAEDGSMVFSSLGPWGLSRLPAEGGSVESVTSIDAGSGELGHYFPELLPGSRAILFTTLRPQRLTVEVLSLDTGERKVLVEGGQSPQYVPSGHLLFYRAGSIQAVPFDEDRLETAGSPTVVVENVHLQAQYSVSRDGTLAYLPSTLTETLASLVLVSRTGSENILPLRPERYVPHPRLSPDGHMVAVAVGAEGAGSDLWIVDLARDLPTRFTFSQGEPSSVRPVWSADGNKVFFTSNLGGTYNIFVKPADASSRAEQLTTGAYRVPTSVSSDGKFVIFRQLSERTGWDLGMLILDGERETRLLLETEFDEHTGMLSPDQRWLAYVSNESGRDEVYLRAFPEFGRRWQVSLEGGDEPMWSRDSEELFYRDGHKMMAVPIAREPELTIGKPVQLFENSYASSFYSGAPSSNYDVSRDGRFLMIKSAESVDRPQVRVVLHWFEELRRLAPPP
jgi:serine/threonine-protein kinase